MATFYTQALLSQFDQQVPSSARENREGPPSSQDAAADVRPDNEQDQRESPFEQRALCRGWKALNRWLNPGFYRDDEFLPLYDD